MKQNIEVNAIKDSDIIEFLKKYELYEKYLNGELFCEICEDVITRDNLGGFLIRKNKILLFCNCPVCIEKAVDYE